MHYYILSAIITIFQKLGVTKHIRVLHLQLFYPSDESIPKVRQIDWTFQKINSVIFFSGREKCICALTGKLLFETKSGIPLYGVGLAVLES